MTLAELVKALEKRFTISGPYPDRDFIMLTRAEFENLKAISQKMTMAKLELQDSESPFYEGMKLITEAI